MKTTQRSTIKHRRRRDGLTNYKKRLILLESKLNRLVIRKSNKHVLAQIVEYHPEGDKILVSAKTTELAKMGYRNSTSNITASYLCGLLLAKKAERIKVGKVIVDLGLQPSIKGSKLYAVVKGCIDGKLNVIVDKEMLPDESRIKGDHIKNYAELIKSTDKYKKIFSGLLKKNVSPEKIAEAFENAKKQIIGG